jgi:hypothetical protein
MEVYMIDLRREICKPIIKLDFTAHDIMESLSESEPRARSLESVTEGHDWFLNQFVRFHGDL